MVRAWPFRQARIDFRFVAIAMRIVWEFVSEDCHLARVFPAFGRSSYSDWLPTFAFTKAVTGCRADRGF